MRARGGSTRTLLHAGVADADPRDIDWIDHGYVANARQALSNRMNEIRFRLDVLSRLEELLRICYPSSIGSGNL